MKLHQSGFGLGVFELHIGQGYLQSHVRLLALRQMCEHIALLVDLAALDPDVLAEGVLYGLVQALAAVDHIQVLTVLVQTAGVTARFLDSRLLLGSLAKPAIAAGTFLGFLIIPTSRQNRTYFTFLQ